ncbi:MAG: site-2 protease family protein [Oscillospiraceae bacterium]
MKTSSPCAKITSMIEVFKNLDWSVLTDALLSVIPALICITIHECSHGFVALKLGDTTAKDMGRLTLNPLKHFDILGFVMLAFVGFGWAKPVPIDMRRFKNPKRGMAVSALAGPVSNILLSVLLLFLYGLLFVPIYSSSFGYYVLYTLYRTAYLSAALAVFNIIPIPPLDGSKVLFSLISDDAYYKLMRYERYGMIILLILIVTDVLNGPLNTAVSFVFNKLFFFAGLGTKITNIF